MGSQSNQSVQDTLLVITGVFGNNGNGVHEKFDPDNITWSEWTTKDMGYGHGVVVAGEWMAVIGGETPMEYKSDTHIYNLRTKEWRIGPQMKQPRFHLGHVSVGIIPSRFVVFPETRDTVALHIFQQNRRKID